MPFHVRFRTRPPGSSFEMRFDLSEEELRRRVITPYDTGTEIVVSGRTIPVSNIERIEVFETDLPSSELEGMNLSIARQGGEWLYGSSTRGKDVTERFIDKPPGTLQKSTRPNPPGPDSQTVFVVHGRDLRLRDSVFAFLRAIGLAPLEFSVATMRTGKATPYVGEILDHAFQRAQAVLVLFTPDDEARLRDHHLLSEDPPHERELTPQARPNVLFEAGMAMRRNADRTVLVEVGVLRPFSDIFGRHVIRLNNTSPRRQELAQRLEVAGCPVDLSGTDWHSAGDFSLKAPRGPARLPASEEPTHPDYEPDDTEVQILKLLAQDRSDDPSATEIALALKMTGQRALYHLERLQEHKYVLQAVYIGQPHEWSLSQKGRALLVASKLL